MASEPCRKPPQEPLSLRDTRESLIDKANMLVTETEQAIEDLLSQVDPEAATVENFLQPIAHLANTWCSISRTIRVYQLVSPSEAIRKASVEAMKILETGAREGWNVSEWIRVIIDGAGELDPESQKFLQDKAIAPMLHQGDASSSQHKNINQRLYEITQRIDKIVVLLQENTANENGGFWASKAELADVPSNILDCLDKGVGVYKGKFRVTYDESVCSWIMEHAADPDLRQKLYVGKENCCSANIPLVKELISLRHEKANLHGKSNWMAFKSQNLLLGDFDAVQKLLARFHERVDSIGVLNSLQETKSLDIKAKVKTLYLWDEPYYKRMWLEQSYGVNYQTIAEYFEIKTTIHGMLQIYSEMLTLSFHAVDNPGVWHESVLVFAVWDDSKLESDFSGYLYIDALPRLGKIKGARCVEIEPSYVCQNGQRRYSTSALIGSFQKLLDHKELIRLFHELGHCMHQLLSRTRYAKFHGTRLANDFIEIPSTLLEHWCWLPAQLKRLSQHHQTGAKIPDYLVNNLIRTKFFNEALDLSHVARIKFDVAVHALSSQKEAEEMDIADVYNRIMCDITGLRGPESTGRAKWGHGYAVRTGPVTGYAGYYFVYMVNYCISEYVWEKIFSKDPMNKEVAMRYRRQVLEKGATEKPLDMLENLIGERLDLEDLCGRGLDEHVVPPGS